MQQFTVCTSNGDYKDKMVMVEAWHQADEQWRICTCPADNSVFILLARWKEGNKDWAGGWMLVAPNGHYEGDYVSHDFDDRRKMGQAAKNVRSKARLNKAVAWLHRCANRYEKELAGKVRRVNQSTATKHRGEQLFDELIE